MFCSEHCGVGFCLFVFLLPILAENKKAIQFHDASIVAVVFQHRCTTMQCKNSVNIICSILYDNVFDPWYLYVSPYQLAVISANIIQKNSPTRL